MKAVTSHRTPKYKEFHKNFTPEHKKVERKITIGL
jgi:hypothetical protein